MQTQVQVSVQQVEQKWADKLAKLSITGIKSQVAQGVLGLSIAPIGEQGKNNDAYESLTRVCTLAGVELNTINQYREVVAALGIKSDHTAVRCFSWSALRKVAKAPLAAVGTKGEGEKSQAVRERFLNTLMASSPDARFTVKQVEDKFLTVTKRDKSGNDKPEPPEQAAPLNEVEDVLAHVAGEFSHEALASADLTQGNHDSLTLMVALPNLTDEQVEARWVALARYALAQAKAFQVNE